MTRLCRIRCALLAAAAAALPLCGCGAGIVTGVFAGNRGGSSPPQQAPPSIVVTDPKSPINPPRSVIPQREILFNNFELSAAAEVEVSLFALGVESKFTAAVVSLGLDTRIRFAVRHPEISAKVGVANFTKADIVGSLVAKVDGREIGSAAYTLVRQRVTTLAPTIPGSPYEFVSVLGSRFEVEVTGQAGEPIPQATLLVGIPGRAQPEPASNVQVRQRTGSESWLVSGIAPPVQAPSGFFVEVEDPTAGLSTTLFAVYYHPEVLGGAPRYGTTDGGSFMLLLGQGLVPLKNRGTAQETEDFSRVRVIFAKDGREVSIPGTAMRTLSSSVRELEFDTPPSPDGRPGSASVSVVVTLENGVEAEGPESGFTFTYQRPAPNFGPRGALLSAAPVAFTLAPVIDTHSSADDVLVLTDVAGTAHVELLVAEDNGMLSSFGDPLLAAEPSRPPQSSPVDLCAGDFDRDGATDVLIANANPGSAENTLLLGAPRPAPPLRRAAEVAPHAGRTMACRAVDLNSDSVPDTVIVPEQSARRAPEIILSQPQGSGRPGFAGATPVDPRIRDHQPFDAIEVGDFDRDGFADLACLRGQPPMKLVVGYGDGAAGTGDVRVVDLVIPGYEPSLGSRGIGLHALSAATGSLPLAVVMEGIDVSINTKPTVAVLPPAGVRGYQLPTSATTASLPGTTEAVASAAGDLDGAAGDELVVGGQNGSNPMLQLLHWDGSALAVVAGGVQDSLEKVEDIRSLAIATAAPADGTRIQQPIKALFAQHALVTTSGREERVTTWMGAPGPRLLAPDASLDLGDPVLGLVLGDFSGRGSDPSDPRREALDIMEITPFGVRTLVNDGVGGFQPSGAVGISGIVPNSAARIPRPTPGAATDIGAFLLRNGQVAVISPGQPRPLLSEEDLRLFASEPTWDVTDVSKIVAGDVDGDRLVDLVVMLLLQDPASSLNKEVVLVLLRGNGSTEIGAFPFHVPDPAAPVVRAKVSATDVVLGDFVRVPGQPLALTPLEAALALDGASLVRFYRYDPGPTAAPNDDGLTASSANESVRWLLAGSGPRKLVAADFDDNLTVDLAVASNDGLLRVFLNDGSLNPALPLEVNIGAFRQSRSAPPLPAGQPAALLTADMNGDALLDLVAVSEDAGVGFNYAVGSYINSSPGEFVSLRILPPVRTGNQILVQEVPVQRNARMYPWLGDVSWDGAPDLVLGWNDDLDKNVRVLFGAAR